MLRAYAYVDVCGCVWAVAHADVFLCLDATEGAHAWCSCTYTQHTVFVCVIPCLCFRGWNFPQRARLAEGSLHRFLWTPLSESGRLCMVSMHFLASGLLILAP